MNWTGYLLCFTFTAIVQKSCDGFLLETKLGKFLQSASANAVLNNVDEKSSASEYRKLDKDAIISAFNGFRQIIDDPMIISERTMNYEIPDVIRTSGFIKNLTVRHLTNTTLNYVFVAPDDSYSELNISFPLLTISGLYNMTFYADRHNISVYGNGSFTFELENLRVLLKVTVQKDQEGYSNLGRIDWNQTLGGIKIEIKNLLDDEEVSSILSENLSVILPALHNAYKPVIDDFMSRVVTVYWKLLFLNYKQLNLETIIQAFVKQAANKSKSPVPN